MKILFFTGGIEPGKDGVGDYTRRIAEHLIGCGIQARIVALYDPFIQDMQFEYHGDIAVNRMGKRTGSVQRKQVLSDLAANWKPDWCSLQFVPYGYHRKGLCFNLVNWLSHFRKCQWHFFFHETWIGSAEEHSLKERMFGLLQKRVVKRLLREYQPTRIDTHIKAYQNSIRRLGFEVDILPLFCNIRIAKDQDENQIQLLTGIVRKQRNQYVIFLLFGSIYNPWRFGPLLDDILEITEAGGKKVAIVQCGRGGANSPGWKALEKDYKDSVQLHALGEVDEDTASRVMQISDFGVATTPWQLIGKSSAVATLIAHGLPVVVNRDDYHSRYVPDSDTEIRSPRLFRWNENASREELAAFLRLSKDTPKDNLPDIAQRFMERLELSPKSCVC